MANSTSNKRFWTLIINYSGTIFLRAALLWISVIRSNGRIPEQISIFLLKIRYGELYEKKNLSLVVIVLLDQLILNSSRKNVIKLAKARLITFFSELV